MKSVMLLTFFFLLSYFPLKAQIVFTAADLPQIGDKVITASAAVADTLNPGSAGANQTWDFSFLIASDTISLDVVDASTTPFADSFPNAGLALQSGDFFTYAQLTSDALFSLGSSIDPSMVMNLSPIRRTSPPDKIYELPTTSTTAYIDQYGSSTGFAGTPPLDSILTTSETTDTVMVDGYGTLITPAGTYQALRLHTRTSTTTTTATMISGVWLPATSNTVLTESYSWIAKETKGEALSIFYNANGQALSASWSLNQNTGVAPAAVFVFEDRGEGEVAFSDFSLNNPTSWNWDFGDGNTSSEQNPTHTFAAAGIYDVCLTVGNEFGSNTTCQMISIQLSVAPLAAFTFENKGEGEFAFTDVSANGPLSWSWDFGDGNTSNEQNPTHTFASSGTYNVCLTVGNVAGDHTICQMIAAVVSVAPVAAFSVEDQGGGQFTFTDASTNTPTSWSWDFDDGNTSSEQNPTHTFAASGTYNVCLTVGNVAGDNTICEMVNASITSTQALQRQYGFRLYPNPTSMGFQIEIRQLAQEALLIRFYNQIGQEIFSASLKGDQYIDAHAWPKGVYNYSVLSKNGGLMGSGRVLVE